MSTGFYERCWKLEAENERLRKLVELLGPSAEFRWHDWGMNRVSIGIDDDLWSLYQEIIENK